MKLIRHLRARLSQQPLLLFISCLLAYSLAISLPGFLWLYFWMGTGFFVSLLLGFGMGCAALGLFEVFGLGRSTAPDSPPSRLKPRLVLFLTSLVTFVLGCLLGSAVQHAKTGWRYEVRASEIIPTDLGPVQWSYVTESVGMPFLDPGTTVLEWNGLILYKAKRVFQESYPLADKVRSSKNSLEWEDGQHRYHLTIQKLDSPPKD